MAEGDAAEPVVIEGTGIELDSTVDELAAAMMPQEDEPDAGTAAAAVVEDKPEQEGAKAAPVVADKAAATVDTLQPSNVDTPPDTWRAEAKAQWATVPPGIKEEIRKRESDMMGYVERSKQPVAVGEKLMGMIQPYLADFQKTGTDPWANMEAMFRIQDRLMYGSPEEKLAIVSGFAQQAGVKIENGQISAAPDAQAAYTKQLETRLAALEGGVKAVTSTVQEARLGELQQSIRKFAEDVEAHPFFNEVADEITHFIKTGAARDLEHAYTLACASNPVIRQKVVDAQAAKAAAASTAAAAERASKAKVAAKVRVRSTTTGTAAQPTGDIDKTLKDALAEIHAR